MSNSHRYPHNEPTPTSAPLRNASISYFSREYPSDDTEPEQTFLNLSSLSRRNFSHRLVSCPQPIYEACSLRQHGTLGRCRCTTQGSPWSFSVPPMNHTRIPSASIGSSHGSNITNLVAFDNPTFVMNTFPDFVQEQDVVSGTTRIISDVQRLQTFIPGQKRSGIGAMGIEYGFSDVNMKFNNRRSPSSTGYPMPIRNTRKRLSYSVTQEQGQIQIQSSTDKMSDSTSAEVKRHSTYSPSVSVAGTRWHCNGCEYNTEREQDMIRHCSSLRHGGRRFFACPSCGKTFSRQDSVTRHSKRTNCGLQRSPELWMSASH